MSHQPDLTVGPDAALAAIWRAHQAGTLSSRTALIEASVNQDIRPESQRYDETAERLSLPDPAMREVATAPREYSARPITLHSIAQILAVPQVPTSAAASATRARSRVEVYLFPQRVIALKNASFVHDPHVNELIYINDLPEAGDALNWYLRCNPTPGSAVLLCLAVDLEAELRSYGARAYRYVNQDAGALALSLDRAAAAIGLATSLLYDFDDARVTEAICSNRRNHSPVPLMLQAIGLPNEMPST